MAGRLLVVVVVVVALLALPSSAAAVDCATPPLADADGVQYDWNANSEISTVNRDAFEFSGTAYFDYAFTASFYEDLGDDDCTTEDGGREVVWPKETFGDLQISAKVFVPAEAPAFVRQLWLFENTGAAPVDKTVYRYFESPYDPRDVVTTSSGDAIGTEADDWLTWHNGADVTDPTVAIVWQGSDALLSAPVEHVYQDCCATLDKFDPVVTSATHDLNTRDTVHVEPGETAVLMHVSLLRSTDGAAATAAAELAALPPALLAGMAQSEVAGLRNFLGTDADADGVANADDNCALAANPDQANVDADALGDACDPDDDGDGLTDEVEIAFGTDPLRADTDGDGRADAGDACPKTSGPGTDGCPVGGSATPPLVPAPLVTQVLGRVDPRSTTATLTPARDRRPPFVFTARGSVLPPDGISAQQACSSPGFVTVRVRRGRRAVVTRRARLQADCTFVVPVRIGNRRRIGSGRRSLTFTVRWLGNRFLEPAAIRTFTRRVG